MPRYPPLRPRDKNASIEQLLCAVEMECGGPDYKYIPREFSISPSQGDNDSIVSGGSAGRVLAKTNLRSTQNGHVSRENYDILTPPDSMETLLPVPSYSSTFPSTPASALPPVPVPAPPPSLARRPSPLTLKQKVKYHHYETLSPRLPSEDGDTYVYMAPRKEFDRSCSLPDTKR